MGILVQLLWSAAMKEFETPPPAPRVSPRPSPPVRNFSPKLVVTGEAPAPRSPDPFQWQLASHGHKAEESSFPLNPVWFSSTVLDAMEEVSPSNLSSPVDYQPSPRHKKRAKLKTPSPTTPPWTITDAGCDPPSPAKRFQQLTSTFPQPHKLSHKQLTSTFPQPHKLSHKRQVSPS
ncbi:unnamed protein product [Merluccius merluccius]